MTNQHRATPEQWADQEKWARDDADSSCILELRSRVEALEARPAAAPAPADSLVERVADAIGTADDEGLTNMTWNHHARAAIREVAAALIDWHDSDQVVHTAWEAGKWLEREAGK